MARNRTRLYKVIFNKDNHELYSLVAAFNHQQAINRVSEILNVKKSFITDVIEINTGATKLLLAKELIDLLLEFNCRSYMKYITANQMDYLNKENKEAIQRAKYKLKGK